MEVVDVFEEPVGRGKVSGIARKRGLNVHEGKKTDPKTKVTWRTSSVMTNIDALTATAGIGDSDLVSIFEDVAVRQQQ
jgi:hypothetical protein